MESKKTAKKRTLILLICYLIILIGLLCVNLAVFRSYEKSGIVTIVPMDSLFFLLIGMVVVGISCFTSLQFFQYKTGIYFSVYVLLFGISIALAPCSQLNEPLITFIRGICSFGSSITLFLVMGYLTLQSNKKLFRISRVVLILFSILGVISQIFSFFSATNFFIYAFAAESVNGSIILSALLSLIMIGVHYKKNNDYGKKQSRILFLGIGIGILLFLMVSFLPNVYVIQNEQAETEAFIELSLLPTETVAASLPLLLFSGVSIAIIFILIHREFVINNMRLKLRYFILIPVYIFGLNILIFTYGDCPIWLFPVMNGLILLPFLVGLWNLFNPIKGTEEQTYQWRLMEAVEKEKQQLSSYLHDEVLQLLIAFYRQVQSDRTGKYDDMKASLSKLISQIRNISHNLYPTMVEDLGLEQSLYIFVDEIQKNYPNIKITYQYMLKDGILPKSLAMTFYRVAKEITTNGVKHSGGQMIMLSLYEDKQGYYIQIKDNGKGFSFPKNDDLLKSPHMGLYTVKKQVAALQGRIHFESTPETGTSYDVYFPKQEEIKSDT